MDARGVALDDETAMARLASADVGRVAVVVRGHPFIFPVNHRVIDGVVFFRTDDGVKLDGVFTSPSVAFEADGIDAYTGEAWSVIVAGQAQAVADADRLAELESLLPSTFTGAEPPFVVEIRPNEISGRTHRPPSD